MASTQVAFDEAVTCKSISYFSTLMFLHIHQQQHEIIDQNSFKNYSKDNEIYFIGSGQKKCKELINSNDNLIFYNKETFPSSKEMADISYQKFLNSDFENLAYFEPAYLKNFILDSFSR